MWIAICHARVAVAYANLNKPHLYEKEKQDALDELNTAAPHLAQMPKPYKLLLAVKQLVESKSFVKDAPDSEALAHI